jgi:hypothetical protein
VADASQLLNGHGDVDAAHKLLCGALDVLPDSAFAKYNNPLFEVLYNLLLVCFFGGRPELWGPFQTAIGRLEPEPPPLLAVLAKTFGDPARSTGPALDRLEALINRLPEETSPARIVRVGVHGAGWVFGNAHTHDRLIRELAAGTGAAVVFPNYSLSPEARYPSAIPELSRGRCPG